MVLVWLSEISKRVAKLRMGYIKFRITTMQAVDFFVKDIGPCIFRSISESKCLHCLRPSALTKLAMEYQNHLAALFCTKLRQAAGNESLNGDRGVRAVKGAFDVPCLKFSLTTAVNHVKLWHRVGEFSIEHLFECVIGDAMTVLIIKV
jgi:hypothetical protein